MNAMPQLAEFVGRIVQASEHGRINAAEFTLFNFAYDAVEDAIKDRHLQLERTLGQDRKVRLQADDRSGRDVRGQEAC